MSAPSPGVVLMFMTNEYYPSRNKSPGFVLSTSPPRIPPATARMGEGGAREPVTRLRDTVR